METQSLIGYEWVLSDRVMKVESIKDNRIYVTDSSMSTNYAEIYSIDNIVEEMEAKQNRDKKNVDFRARQLKEEIARCYDEAVQIYSMECFCATMSKIKGGKARKHLKRAIRYNGVVTTNGGMVEILNDKGYYEDEIMGKKVASGSDDTYVSVSRTQLDYMNYLKDDTTTI